MLHGIAAASFALVGVVTCTSPVVLADENNDGGFYSQGSISDIANATNELLSEDNLLIVELTLGRYRLASDVFVYHTQEATLVPLQPLFDALEFPILTDPESRKASGWLLRENNRFDLDANAGRLILGGEQVPLRDGATILSDGFDLYVDIQTVNQWFPLTAQLNVSRLQLHFVSDEPLPLESRLAREKKRLTAKSNRETDIVPFIDDHYEWFGSPAVDINLGTTLDRSPGDTQKDVAYDSSYSIQSSMDLLKFQSQLSLLKGSRDSDSVKRLTLSKKPDNPNETLIANLKYVDLGDTYGASNALVFGGAEGLGANLRWGELNKGSDFGKRIIEGDAAPGWEVELYHNNALVDFQIVDDQGRYRFEDVSVDYGENLFDVRLYGPQGQESSRRERIRVGNTSLPPGKVAGNISSINLDKNVFDNATKAGITGDEKQSYFEIQTGVTQRLSVGANYARHENESLLNKQTEYFGAHANIAFAALSLETQFVKQGEAGHSSLLGLQTRLGNTSISYLHKNFRNFSSERNQQGRVRDDYELRLSGSYNLLKTLPVSYQVSANYENSASGVSTHSINPRLGFPLYGGRLTLDNTFNGGSVAASTTTGQVRFTRSAGYRTTIRSELDYRIEDDVEVTSLGLNTIWRPRDNLRLQLSLSGDVTHRDNNQIDLSGTFIFGQLSLSPSIRWREGGYFSAGLNLEFALDKPPRRPWKIHGEPIASTGRIEANVFIDNDMNGQFSEGDEPVQSVRFSGRQKWKNAQTGINGKTYLYGLRGDVASLIELDSISLEDPYLISEFTKRRVISHAGALRKIDVPIVSTGAVEGMLFVKRGNNMKALAGIPVHLAASDTDVERNYRVSSEFDGYFVFEKIPPGNYLLTLEPAALDKLQLKAVDPIPVVIDPVQGITVIDDLTLQFKTENLSSPEIQPVSTRIKDIVQKPEQTSRQAKQIPTETVGALSHPVPDITEPESQEIKDPEVRLSEPSTQDAKVDTYENAAKPIKPNEDHNQLPSSSLDTLRNYWVYAGLSLLLSLLLLYVVIRYVYLNSS